MSFNPTDTINRQNYEEYFVLYIDNELTAAQVAMVDRFVAGHPDLKAELELLQDTKLLPAEEGFGLKDALFSGAMKLNAAEEDLLLYIDNELPASQALIVEKKIAEDAEYAQQHLLLQQTKLDATEVIRHPAKEELYRRAERRIVLAGWMRIAAAVILLLFASLFFLLNKKETVVDNGSLAGNTTTKPATDEKRPTAMPPVEPSTEVVVAKTSTPHTVSTSQPVDQPKNEFGKKLPTAPQKQTLVDANAATDLARTKAPVVKFDVSRFAPSEQQPGELVALNKTITRDDVTSGLDERTTPIEGDENTAGSGADFKDTKRTPAKGFFRKVSRFIERRTGFGTVNADNELLIGAVALKLK